LSKRFIATDSIVRFQAQGVKQGGIWVSHRFYLYMKMSLIRLDQALTVNPASSKTWYDRGCALAEVGDYTEALVSFNQALILKHDDVAAWVFQSVMLIHLERFEEALRSCDRALEIKPKDPEALLFRGVALQRLGQYRKAYASYENALGRWRKPSSWGQRVKGFLSDKLALRVPPGFFEKPGI
jgi:tetratricopeptide (TPR) repeat protein